MFSKHCNAIEMDESYVVIDVTNSVTKLLLHLHVRAFKNEFLFLKRKGGMH